MRITNLRRKKMPPLLPKKIKWFVLGLFVGSLCTPAPLPNSPVAIPNVPLFRNVQDNNNSFQARGCPFIPERTLSSLMDRIIFCESSGRVDAKNSRSSAYGLCQFTNGTWEYVQEKWNMSLERKNEEHQIYACERLLREEGTRHWNASKKCWGY